MLNSPWPKYLRAVGIDGLHQWRKQEIRFDFPVTVIAGENGSGKSTVLKAAAAAYSHPTDRTKSFYPAIFFPDTAWERVTHATLTYKVREGKSEKTYTARKISERWRFQERPRRHVIFEDISRTLPLDATVGYATIARRNALETGADQLDPNLTLFYSSILGRSYDSVKLATSNIDHSRKVGVVNCSGAQFSQFHQGAGEDATLDLLQTLQDVPEAALVIIDEVEASLQQDPEVQLLQLRKFAKTQGWKIVEEYVDEESGAKADRPAFKKMFGAAAKHDFDVLLFWSLDRFSREGIVPVLTSLKRLSDYGVKYRSFQEPYIDTTHEWGDLIAAFAAKLAELERKRIRARVIAGLEKARASGKELGRRRLVVDRTKVWSLRDQGKSIREISALMKYSHGTVQRVIEYRESSA